MYEAKSGIKIFSLYWAPSPPPPEKVAQNQLKHILVLEFLRSDDFRWGRGSLCEIQTDTPHSDQISRSTRRDGTTKNQCISMTSSPFPLIVLFSGYRK